MEEQFPYFPERTITGRPTIHKYTDKHWRPFIAALNDDGIRDETIATLNRGTMFMDMLAALRKSQAEFEYLQNHSCLVDIDTRLEVAEIIRKAEQLIASETQEETNDA